MRHRRKRDIVIELTSLLDVIMILIFMVMNENSKLVSEVQNRLETARQENVEQADKINTLSTELDRTRELLDEEDPDGVRDRLRIAEDQLGAYQALDDEIILLNVTLRNNSNNSIRYLTYSRVSEPENEKKSLIRSVEDRNRADRNLRMFLAECVQRANEGTTDGNQPVVRTIFFYDPDRVYAKDVEMVDAVLRDLENDCENFGYRIKSLTDE